MTHHAPARMAALAVALSAQTSILTAHMVDNMRSKAEETLPPGHPLRTAILVFASMYEVEVMNGDDKAVIALKALGADLYAAADAPEPTRPAPGRMTLNEFAAYCHQANQKWWQDPRTGQPITRNKGELLCLIHSEISEAMEGERKNLMDDKLPHRRMAEVELADALIRIFDYAAGFGYDLQGAFEEKTEYNRTRADHTHAARIMANGKAF